MRAHELDLGKLTDDDIYAIALGDDELYGELLLKIRTKASTIEPLIYNQPQIMLDRLCQNLLKERGRVQVINLKARQMGLSTAIQARGFKRASTLEHFTSQVVSHDDDAVVHLLGMSKLYLQELPKQYTPMTKYQPKTALEFANPYPKKGGGPGLRSHIKIATSRNSRIGRGDTINFGHLSEMAFWDREPEKLLTGFMQAVPDHGPVEVFIESTANGAEGYFYELWRDAISGRSGWQPLFIPWWEMEVYRKKPSHKLKYDKEEYKLIERHKLDDEQLQWRRTTLMTKCNNDLITFKQEYPSDWREAFQSSGASFFPIRILEPMIEKREDEEAKTPPPFRKGRLEKVEVPVEGENPIHFVDDPDGWCIMKQEPQKNMAYIVAVDASEGTEDEEHDPSGVLVTSCPEDAAKMSQEVFEYNGYLDPDQLADFSELVGEYYNWAFIIHEDNNHGQILTYKFMHSGYQPVYEREVIDDLSRDITTKVGFQTNARTKPMMLGLLKAALREGRIEPMTSAAVYELMIFRKSKVAHKGGLYSGNAMKKKGAHDERVIIRAMTQVAMQQAPRKPIGDSFDYDEDVKSYYARA